MRVVVNAAISADGKISTRRREQIAISGDEDFARVHRLRAEADAVMVGVGTVLADDPSLVTHDEDHRRTVQGEVSPPWRVVADSRCRTPTDAAILGGDPRSYVLTSQAAPEEQGAALEAAGATVVVAGDDRVDLPDALARLENDGVEHLLVEGGGELVFSLFASGLVDELSTFVGPTILGGADAPTLVDGEGFVDHTRFPELALRDVDRLDDGVVLSWDVLG